jgi:hypothetical protein
MTTSYKCSVCGCTELWKPANWGKSQQSYCPVCQQYVDVISIVWIENPPITSYTSGWDYREEDSDY